MYLVTALIFGFFIGLFYFTSLWVTVRQLPIIQRPIPLIIGSLIGRLTIAIFALYLVMDGHWERLLMALFGLILARTILIKRWQSKQIFTGWDNG